MKLGLSVRNPVLGSLESLKVALTLENDEGVARTIPGPYDRTAALTFIVYRPDGSVERRMTGLTSQMMMSASRVDPTPMLEELRSGDVWRWDLDLATYHYALPAGEYAIEAVYSFPDASSSTEASPDEPSSNVSSPNASPPNASSPDEPSSDESSSNKTFSNKRVGARSDRVPVRVRAVELREVAFLRDAPVLDGIALLFDEGANGSRKSVLRQHNAQRPLAAWYSERLDRLEGDVLDAGVERTPSAEADTGFSFFAAARFFTTDSFESSFHKWLLTPANGVLKARRFVWGRPEGDVLEAPLPANRRLIPTACYDETDMLTVFFQRATGMIEAYELIAGSLRLLYEHDVPWTSLPPAIRADCDFVHIVTPHQGLLYDRLTLAGAPQVRVPCVQSLLEVFSCDIDPAERLAKAVLRSRRTARAPVATGAERIAGAAPTAGDEPATDSTADPATDTAAGPSVCSSAGDPPWCELIVVGPEPTQVDRFIIGSLQIDGEIEEMSFDRDPDGRFHLLLSTSNRELYYVGSSMVSADGIEPILIARGEPRFFPVVHAPGGAYLGFYKRDAGYRFGHFRRHAKGGEVVFPVNVP